MAEIISESERHLAGNGEGFIKKDEFNQLVDNSRFDILNKLKWQLNHSRRLHSQGTLTAYPDLLPLEIDGYLRGDLAERLSGMLQIHECSSVVPLPSADRIPLAMTTSEEYFESRSKQDILVAMVKKSLYEKPPLNILYYAHEESPETGFTGYNAGGVIKEIIDGYCEQGDPPRAGIFYTQTVAPDGLLINPDGDVSGFVEVKGYGPETVSMLAKAAEKQSQVSNFEEGMIHVTKILNGHPVNFRYGIDIAKEVRFIDIVRSVGYGLPQQDYLTPAVLRFLYDAPVDSLKSYANLLAYLGYKNIGIQKLPLSSKELSRIGKRMIVDNLAIIKSRYIYPIFTSEEIQSLETLSEM